MEVESVVQSVANISVCLSGVSGVSGGGGVRAHTHICDINNRPIGITHDRALHAVC